MYINFDESRPDTPRLDRSLTTLEQVLLTLLMYCCVVIALLVWPHLGFVKAMEARRQQAIQAELQRRQEAQKQFVYVEPKVEIETKIPPKLMAALSDRNRRAATIERAPKPKNDMPFSRGNSPERVITDAQKFSNQPKPAQPAAPAQQQPAAQQPQDMPNPLALPSSPTSTIARNEARNPLISRGPAAGILSDAIRNVQRYAQGETLQNVQGNGDFGPSIQFDTKGVDFGPWMRRFIAQIKRNWFVPYAAMSLHGNVVLSFYVHRDGSITDLQVVRPSTIDAFTNSAFNAVKLSNPTMPFPPEFPDEKGQFVVTFYFNETPPGGGE